MLIDRLDELVTIVRELGRPVASLLVPGISRREVERAYGAPVPEDVATWFGWCNGVRSEPGQIQDTVNLVPGYRPLSAAEAAALRPAYEDDPVLGTRWMPLLGGPSGDLYAAVWSGNERPGIAGVLIGEPTEIEFADTERLVDFFVRCYRQGAFTVGSDGLLTMDTDRYDAIYADIAGG
ncbi:hypothetical protein [Micromonospora andamanensis]|uniref:SMI1/KNR4 family protein n=1 Tax=Micromonospora andamanensis TaxID=1287068 RepID=A0ABQ4HY35_9ACTN|nr:hypothetical protein [Micromonospora andamanensis]GIJ10585.1 hypothetical protein Van01_37990 [Micromonospora andamanensis]